MHHHTEPAPGRQLPPNHHAHHEGFSGWRATAFALRFAKRGRWRGEVAAELAQVGAGDRVLDVGCGPGTALRAATRRGATAIGIEPSAEMLRVGRRLAGPGIELRQGGAEALPVDDGWASVAWTIASVHHWPDIDGGLREVHRALAPGGRFVAIERSSPIGATGVASHGWTDAQADAFAACCRAAGFTDVTVGEPRLTSGGRGGRHQLIAVTVVAHRP